MDNKNIYNSPELLLSNIKNISDGFASQRHERQTRRSLHQEDFDKIKDAGYLLVAVPESMGGYYKSLKQSARLILESLRILAHGDSSVALVSAMHPSVLVNWLEHVSVPAEFKEQWENQQSSIFKGVLQGNRWGTITSEPGSGGDIAKTKAIAKKIGNNKYSLTGQKHFGSGSGMNAFMITTALPEGEDNVDTFFLDMRNKPWDGSEGVKLIAEWDGHGMTSTQSHGMMFEDFPVERMAWKNNFADSTKPGSVMGPAAFTAVIFGIVQVAVETARKSVLKDLSALRAYDKVEWTNIETDFWLMEQAYNGMLQHIETAEIPLVAKAKLSMAQLAESIMTRICRVVGGGSFARKSPYGYWAQDVKALGFLRPPWPLAYDQLWDEIAGIKK